MVRTTIEELKKSRLAAMSADQGALFDNSRGATRLALDVGEKVRDALEAGDIGDTLTTIQKTTAVLSMRIIIELSAAN